LPSIQTCPFQRFGEPFFFAIKVGIVHTHYAVFIEPYGAPNPDAPERFIIPPYRADINAKNGGNFRSGEDASDGVL
jgi:hypothetical protein